MEAKECLCDTLSACMPACACVCVCMYVCDQNVELSQLLQGVEASYFVIHRVW